MIMRRGLVSSYYGVQLITFAFLFNEAPFGTVSPIKHSTWCPDVTVAVLRAVHGPVEPEL
jgi:hypothetical protein